MKNTDRSRDREVAFIAGLAQKENGGNLLVVSQGCPALLKQIQSLALEQTPGNTQHKVQNNEKKNKEKKIAWLDYKELTILENSQHFDLCLYLCTTDSLSNDLLLTNIGTIKNRHCSYIKLLISNSINSNGSIEKLPYKPLPQLLALGFSRIELPLKNPPQLECYNYDINRYNKKRAWNNSRHWANPKNFNRFRW